MLIWIPGVFVLWGAALVGWTVRDAVPGLATVYYASPPSLIALVALWLSWLGRRADQSRAVLRINRATAILGVVCLLQWAIQDVRIGSASNQRAESIRIVFWNVGRGHFAEWDRIAEQLLQFDADIIALSEATSDQVQSREYWAEKLSEYEVLPLDAGMVILVKGHARQLAADSLMGQGDYRLASVEVGDLRMNLVMADLASNPLLSRERRLEKLHGVLNLQLSSPTLVVGDFNTPPQSAWFDSWRPDWVRAWDAAGVGYQCTWPQPLPMLTLDHIWGNHGVKFHRCWCEWSSCSDHRPVVAEFTVN